MGTIKAIYLGQNGKQYSAQVECDCFNCTFNKEHKINQKPNLIGHWIQLHNVISLRGISAGYPYSEKDCKDTFAYIDGKMIELSPTIALKVYGNDIDKQRRLGN